MSLRNYYLALELAKVMNVMHLGLSDLGQMIRTTGRQEGIRMTLVPGKLAYTISKLARGALGRTPVTLLNFYHPAMASELAKELAAFHYDTVLIEGIEMSPYLPVIRAANRRVRYLVLDWHNIESEVVSRYANHAASPVHKLYMRRAAGQLRRIECEMLENCDLHLVTSERDHKVLLNRQPAANIVVVENGVDVGHFTRGLQDLEHAGDLIARHRILFVGSMDYSANVDAVTYFVERVWTQIQQMFPLLVFTVVGRNPPERIRALASRPGIEVTGTVADVRPYYCEAFATVVPLRIGGGTRLKILEAMAAGVPVVSTRVGAEGLRVEPETHFMLADTPDQFHIQISRLRADLGLWRKLSAAGRNLVEATYDWDTIGPHFAEIYQGFLQTPQVADRQASVPVPEA